MKKIIVRLVACALVAGIAVPAVSSAQSVGELLSQISALQKQLEQLRAQVEGRKSGAIQAPQAVHSAVPPGFHRDFFDDDRSDDEIVQLNHLRIESVALNSETERSSGITRAVITAVSDFGGGCRKFESEGGASIPCPLLPSVLYNIRVTDETVLLLRTRARAQLSDFEAGNIINVYGLRDPDNNAIEALIIRNLDKPSVERFIQLNNVEVIDGPLSHTPPTTLHVVRKNLNPCLDFSESQKGKEFPCPLGAMVQSPVAQSQGQGQSGQGIAEPTSLIAIRSYEIRVTANTQLLRRDRTPLPLSEIQVGDKLNIYGVAQGGPGVIEARVLRDLSRPPTSGESLRINAKGDMVGYVGRHFQAMFGISGGVMPYDLQPTAGDFPPGLSLTPILPSCPAPPYIPGQT
jgi:hypothetical protein